MPDCQYTWSHIHGAKRSACCFTVTPLHFWISYSVLFCAVFNTVLNMFQCAIAPWFYAGFDSALPVFALHFRSKIPLQTLLLLQHTLYQNSQYLGHLCSRGTVPGREEFFRIVCSGPAIDNTCLLQGRHSINRI